MSSSFVRVTVLSDERHIDLSIPTDVPVIDYMPVILYMVGYEPQSVDDITSWTITDPRHGPLTLTETLDAAAILDGAQLHLTRATEAPEAPFVDDVLATMENHVSRLKPWQGEQRDRMLAGTTAAILVLAGLSLHAMHQSPSSAVSAFVLAVTAVVLARLARTEAGRFTACAAPVLCALASHSLGRGLWETSVWSITAAGAATGTAVALAATAPRQRVLAASAAATAAILALVSAAIESGLSATATFLWATVPLIFLIGYAPSLALSSSGIVALVRQSDEGQLASRAEVDERFARARDRADFTVWTACALLAVTLATLAFSPHWIQSAVAAYISVAVIIRSRSFSQVRHVAPIVATGLSGLVAAMIALHRSLPLSEQGQTYALCAAAIILGLATAATFLLRLDDVAAARVGRLYEAIDIPLTVAVVPLVALAYGVYAFYWAG